MSKSDDIIKEFENNADRVLASFMEEIKTLRTGRASTALIEDIMVEVEGTKMPIKSVCAIGVAGPRQLTAQAWDNSYVKAIEKALQAKNIGLVKTEGNVVYVSLPELTQEYREKLVKELKSLKEQIREKIRRERDELWKDIQHKEKDKEISETDKFKAKERLDKLVKEYNDKIEDIYSKKEEEIKSV